MKQGPVFPDRLIGPFKLRGKTWPAEKENNQDYHSRRHPGLANPGQSLIK